jgi:uncharacterized protein (DUF934 family)
MPLIRNGKLTDDVWSFVEDGQELSPDGCIVVSLARFQAERERLLHGNRSIGVRLEVGDDPGELASYLDRIALIELQFPKYTDGRALSQSQLLRLRHGYKGEIRAIGQVLRDQLRLMIRAGFDAMVLDAKDAEAVFENSAQEFSEFYQAASDTSDTIFLKRHRKTQEKAAE